MSIFNRFPYSNFHGFNMDWILEEVKKATEQAKSAKLTAEETKKYVDDYFNNLDVETELKNQLEEMRKDGTLESIIVDYLRLDKKNIILIGDSFAGGVTGATTPAGKGWIQYCVDNFSNYANFYYNVQPFSGVFGFASSRPFIDILQAIAGNIPDGVRIDKIVVLGGTNDRGIDATSIRNRIRDFVNYAKNRFRTAQVNIGVLGSNIWELSTDIVPNYGACRNYGAHYIADTANLLCLGEYIAEDGVHLTVEGYNYFNPYIAQAVMFDSVKYEFRKQVPLDITIENLQPSIVQPIFDIRVTNVGYSVALRSIDNNTQIGFFDVQNLTPARQRLVLGNYDNNAIRIAQRYPIIVSRGLTIVFDQTGIDRQLRPYSFSIGENGVVYLNLGVTPGVITDPTPLNMRFPVTGENFTFLTR